MLDETMLGEPMAIKIINKNKKKWEIKISLKQK